jgi:hypothetical protein
MRELGLQGAIRGKPVRTTIGDKAAPCPLGLSLILCARPVSFFRP